MREGGGERALAGSSGFCVGLMKPVCGMCTMALFYACCIFCSAGCLERARTSFIEFGAGLWPVIHSNDSSWGRRREPACVSKLLRLSRTELIGHT